MAVEINNLTSGETLHIGNAGQLPMYLASDYVGSAGGKYRLSVHSNLLTAISALTATGDVGQIAQFRWGSSTKTCLIDKIEISMQSVTDAAALQEITLAIRQVGTHTATASGGTTTASLSTVAVLTGDNGKLRAGYPTTALTDFRISDTADLTCGAGARALFVNNFLTMHCNIRAAGTTLERPVHEKAWEAKGSPLILTQDMGIALVNERVVWPATHTATICMAVEWRELLNAEVPSA